ncbi:unnamed protein product [Meloidogyne enterolobii]|uniref:Uncharacterized protein n=4 Tax=Meloidogyne enterolobii TaxID=390850 RepID=A0ACB0XMD0_MELEN|nr:unnamed protein product [Meloidogyne enterolobii]
MQGQVLIFCPTKMNCENLCKLLTNLCPQEFREHRSKERLAILSQLKDEHEGRICPILEAGIKSGVAYHHSGLTNDERLLVEAAYKTGIISIICCTSTLAAGVNLPARRVIIRSPHIGKQMLKKSQYLQMIGRAGRAGLDEKGDCITIVKNGTESVALRNMLNNPLEPCISGLCDDQQREAFFLDLIVLKICSTIDELYQIFKKSLYGIQKHDDTELRILTEKTVQSLLVNQMVLQPEVDHFFSTQIGIATFNANFNPQVALDINKDLSENLSQGIVLSSHFHLLYNCVQMDVEVSNLDWNLFHNEYLTLKKEERDLLHLMGFTEGTIVQFILYASNKMNISVKAQRFYVAFMLRQIWEQRPLWEVAQHFDVPRGWLQSNLQSALAQASSIIRFAERTPSLWALRSLLPEMIKRLSECARQELIPLLSIDCVKVGRARLLYEHGYKTVGSIAKVLPEKLIGDLEGKLNLMQAKRIINSAKTIIRDQIAEKTEELEQLGATDLFEFIKPVNKINNIIRPLQPRAAPTTFQPVSKCFGFEMEADDEEEVENISEQFSNSSSSNNTSNNSC